MYYYYDFNSKNFKYIYFITRHIYIIRKHLRDWLIYTLLSHNTSVNSTMLLLGKIYNSLTRSSPIGKSSFLDNLFGLFRVPSVDILFNFMLLDFVPFLFASISLVAFGRDASSTSILGFRTQWQEFLGCDFIGSTGPKLIDFLVEYVLLSVVDLKESTRVLYDWPSWNKKEIHIMLVGEFLTKFSACI